MTQETKTGFNESLRKRTKEFAVQVIQLCNTFPEKPASRVIRYQLLKCATSVAANFRAATRARSRKEYFAKMCIVVEEADEVQFWFELLDDAALVEKHQIAPFLQESSEILAILTTVKHKI